MKKIVFAGVLIVALGATAWAADYNVCYGTLDADFDGELTAEEFSQAIPDGDMGVFKAADGDGSGTVSHEEWEEWKSSKGYEEHSEG